MSIFLWVWVVLGWAVAIVWFLRGAAMGPILAQRRILHEGLRPVTSPGPLPRVSVVIAAKDEQDNIEACLNSVLAQDYPDFEVIVADDRSTDRTPRILADLKSRFPHRLRVVTISQLADGWFGKCNAMREAVQLATRDWLLFSDADCQFTSPHTIRLAMEEAVSQRIDFLTMIPQLIPLALWEKIVQPVCAIILMAWFQPARVNNPAKKTAYANGAFMLMSRRCYEGIGGHAAVRNRLNEDIDFARLAKTAGWRLRVVENDGLLSSRMYPGFTQGFRGWSRIFYGSLSSRARVGLALLSVVLVSVAPWLSLAAAVVLASTVGPAGWKYALYAWAAAVLSQQAALWRVYGVMTVSRIWSLTYFLGAVVTAAALANAFLKALGATKTTWRATTYRGDGTVHAASAKPTAGEGETPAEPLRAVATASPGGSPSHGP